mmetsp:Transcript_10004/g.10318  ORF Transcript_10004/g.10318 Transcript_10004/m.10318 type:complete len:80 (-) Transcript_10004:156-395(-)
MNSLLTVELKNGVEIRGSVISVDKNLNIVLGDIKLLSNKYEGMFLSTSEVFIRGNTVRYFQFDPKTVDTKSLQDTYKKD